MINSQNSNILVLLAEYNIPPLTYRYEGTENIERGDIIAVPFKKKTSYAVILDIGVSCDFDENKIKAILHKLNLPKIQTSQMEFLEKSSKYYLGQESSFLKMTIPLKQIKLPKEYNLNKTPKIQSFNPAILSPDQEKAYNQLKSFTQQESYSTTLLDGVTGSGKTEIYFKIISDYILNNDNQVLILLPEIVLISQLIDKFKKRFGFEPTVWHSSISPSKKNKSWLDIINGNAKVVIGTRSSLYLPFKKLSLIIVEEEHDTSFKQEDGVLYNARDMAVLSSFIVKIPVILVSATPSMETFCNVYNHKYNIVKLSSRYNDQSMPIVKICDLGEENMQKGTWISPTLKNEIATAINNNNQALLFLNRRGYAPLLMCKSCGHRFVCNHCSSWMVEHKTKKRLECHHCNNQKAIPSNCPECKAMDSLISCGPGVERIEEEAKKLFPLARIGLMTKDTIKNTKDAKDMIDMITEGKIDIIIGTQLIAKGHHFPELSLVGIIDADVGFNGGDLRAPETSFQLFEQVGGRAGREKNQGTVIIQTYYPENDIIKCIANNDKEKFYLKEMLSRKNSDTPPFSRLCSIIISGTREDKVKKIAYELVKNAPLSKGISIFGPSASFLAKIRQKYRYRILIKAKKNFNMQAYLNLWITKSQIPSSIHLKVDIDPYNFN